MNNSYPRKANIVFEKVAMHDEDRSREELLDELKTLREELSQAKQKLKAREEDEHQASQLIRDCLDGYAVLNRHGMFVSCNPAYLKILDYSLEELQEKTFQDITPEPYHPLDQIQFEILQKKGVSELYEKEFIRKDGTRIPVEIRSYLLRNLHGEIIGIWSYLRDNTHRKNTKERVEIFSHAINASLDGINITDMEGNIFYCNEASADIYGYNPKELTGFYVGQLNADPLITTNEIIPAIQRTGDWSGELLQKRKDGSVFPIILRTSLIVDEKNKPLGMIGIVRDITEQKKAEEKNRQLELQLHHSQKIDALGALAGGIAHDFNNLLVPILGISEMVKNQLSPESPQVEQLEIVEEAALEAKDLVSQILMVSRKVPLQTQPLHLKEVVEKVLRLLHFSLPSNILIHQEDEKGLPLIEADPSQLHQALINLCLNAAQAMPEGGTLTVGLKSSREYQFINMNHEEIEGEFVCLAVQDTGTGMDEQTLENIFDPFFTTKKRGKEKGTGLGLSVVSGIVELHGGHIKVDSQSGIGTTFNLYFPLSPIPKKVAQSEESQFVESKKGRILFVDDEPMISKSGKMFLESLGYEVTEFNDSQQALQAFATNPQGFDLILTDYMMPHLTGIQLTEKLKAIRSDISVILLTGYTDMLIEKNLKDWNVDGGLAKPYSLDEMKQAVKRALNKIPS